MVATSGVKLNAATGCGQGALMKATSVVVPAHPLASVTVSETSKVPAA